MTAGSRAGADGDIVLSLVPGDRSLGDEGYRLVVERSGSLPHGAPPRRPVLGHPDPAPAPPGVDRGGDAATRPVAGRGRDDPRPSALRLARSDARRRTALLRRRRRQARHRPDEPLQAQPPPPASHGRPGLAAGDPLLAEADEPRRAGRRWAAAEAGTSPSASTAAIVAYARRRFVDVVPEIDMPGHVNAALASYARLTCDGKAPALYTGIEVGFSSLCIRKELTYAFVDDVVRRGRCPHARAVPPHRRRRGALDRAGRVPRLCASASSAIVRAHGKRLIGWEEIAKTPPAADVGRPALAGPGARPSRRRAGREADHVARAEGVPRHEVHAGLATRARVGRDDDGRGRVRVGSRGAGPRGARARRARRRGAALDRDDRDARRRRPPRVPAPARPRRDRVVTRHRAQVAWLPPAARRPRAAAATRSASGSTASPDVPWDALRRAGDRADARVQLRAGQRPSSRARAARASSTASSSSSA